MRRVLVLSYYYPPSGGPGVQRVLKFTRHLRRFGWEPEVLTVREGAYPERDASLLGDVPPGLAVHRTAALDPFTLYARLTGRSRDEAVVLGSVEGRGSGRRERLARWVRANLFLPDARVGWVPFAVAAGRRLLASGRFDAVLTSGPPHSVHLAGLLLRRLSATPWLADFRDPWTDINYYHELPHTAAARHLDAALERAVLRRADAVVTVSPAWRRLLAGKGERDGRFHVVHNGFDEDDFAPPPPPPDRDAFVLAYVGSLYSSRNPAALWRAVQGLAEAGRVPHLRLRLVGSVDPDVEASIARHGLAERVERVGYVEHAAAVRHMRRSALLVLLVERFAHAEGMITGKLYEYLAAARPVLALGPPGGDAAALLEETGAGHLFAHDDAEAVAETIHAHYAAWERGAPRAGADPSRIAPYSRRVQTGRLAAVLDALAGGPSYTKSGCTVAGCPARR